MFACGASPEPLRVRLLLLRAFDANRMIVDADVVDGQQAEGTIEGVLGNPQVAYIQAHYAKRGCCAAQLERALPAMQI